MNRRYRMIPATLALACAVTLTAPTLADEHADEGPNLGRVSLSLASDFVTGYYFRGIAQEPHGVIWQPSVEVGFLLFEGDGMVNSLSVLGGVWSSMHDENTGSVSGPGAWYEADLYAGISATVAEDIAVTVLYTGYTSPNGAFASVDEVSVEIGYDDSDIWADGDIIDLPGFEGFQPYVVFAFEVDDQADGGNGNAAGFDEGVYFEFGVAPSMTVVDSETSPITMTVPVVLGLSLDNYYEFTNTTMVTEDDAFGYLKVGMLFSMPITAIPSQYGAWEAYAGVDFLFIGDSAAQANNPRDDIGFEIIGTFGMSMSY